MEKGIFSPLAAGYCLKNHKEYLVNLCHKLLSIRLKVTQEAKPCTNFYY